MYDANHEISNKHTRGIITIGITSLWKLLGVGAWVEGQDAEMNVRVKDQVRSKT